MDYYRYEDADELLRLGELMHRKSRFAGRYEFDDQEVLGVARNCTEENEGPDNPFWGRVSRRQMDGKINGFFAGVITKMQFCKGNCAMDLALFVDPLNPSASFPARAIRAFEQWARERKAVEINLGISVGIKDERVGRLYEKLGYIDPLVVYRKDL